MEILIYKVKAELLFLDRLKNKLKAFVKLTDQELDNLVNDYLFTLSFFNKRNDFALYSRIDLKNKNYQSLIGNLLTLQNVDRNPNEIIEYIENDISKANKEFDKIMNNYLENKDKFNLLNLTDELILYFENKNIAFHKNFVVEHFLKEELPVENIVYNFGISNLFTDSSNLTLSKQFQYYLYTQFNVRYQAFGNPFLSWFSTMEDCYCSTCYDLDLPNGLPNFLELNLNCYNNGNWLVMMPTTIKEFKKVFNKIESFINNDRNICFILIYPAWDFLHLDSPYIKEKKITSDLTFQSNQAGKLIKKKEKFCVTMTCFKQFKKLTLF